MLYDQKVPGTRVLLKRSLAQMLHILNVNVTHTLQSEEPWHTCFNYKIPKSNASCSECPRYTSIIRRKALVHTLCIQKFPGTLALLKMSLS